MKRPSFKAVFRSTEFFGVVLFVFAVVFPPFDDIAEVNLAFHMLQHVIIVVAGATISYPLLKKGLIRPRPGWLPKFLLLLAAAAIVYWHLPQSWDAAVLNPFVHAAEHATFLLVGLAVGSYLQALSDSVKISALLAAFFGHMAYAVILIAPWNIQVYPLFSVADQSTLGWSLILTGWMFLIGVAYILRRNPDWLQGFSGGTGSPSEAPKPRQARTPRWVAPAASLALILVLLVYFMATGLAVAAAASPQAASSVVFIVETPVTWQYSPQAITVVLGTNNTVTWVSHSTSYDTITSDTGLFQSGAIQPGGSFSYTFTEPGVYPYHCAFHPWMVGKVTVVASG